jgi:hypothetical protein
MDFNRENTYFFATNAKPVALKFRLTLGPGLSPSLGLKTRLQTLPKLRLKRGNNALTLQCFLLVVAKKIDFVAKKIELVAKKNKFSGKKNRISGKKICFF